MKILKKAVHYLSLLVAAITIFVCLYVICLKYSAFRSFVALEQSKGFSVIPHLLLNVAIILAVSLGLFFATREKKRTSEPEPE